MGSFKRVINASGNEELRFDDNCILAFGDDQDIGIKWDASKLAITPTDYEGASNFEPIRINTVMAGAGATGGRVRVNMETNVQLGGWANALKASVDWKTNGAVTGLGSAFCAEMVMQGAAFTRGTYAVLELELVCPADWSGANNNAVAFINATVSGDTSGEFDDYGFLFDIAGVVSGAGDLFYAATAGVVDAFLKCRINGDTYYLLLAADQS